MNLRKGESERSTRRITLIVSILGLSIMTGGFLLQYWQVFHGNVQQTSKDEKSAQPTPGVAERQNLIIRELPNQEQKRQVERLARARAHTYQVALAEYLAVPEPSPNGPISRIRKEQLRARLNEARVELEVVYRRLQQIEDDDARCQHRRPKHYMAEVAPVVAELMDPTIVTNSAGHPCVGQHFLVMKDPYCEAESARVKQRNAGFLAASRGDTIWANEGEVLSKLSYTNTEYEVSLPLSRNHPITAVVPMGICVLVFPEFGVRELLQARADMAELGLR